MKLCAPLLIDNVNVIKTVQMVSEFHGLRGYCDLHIYPKRVLEGGMNHWNKSDSDRMTTL